MINVFRSWNGLRSLINLGPKIFTINAYDRHMVKVGKGLLIRNQSLTLLSENIKCLSKSPRYQIRY